MRTSRVECLFGSSSFAFDNLSMRPRVSSHRPHDVSRSSANGVIRVAIGFFALVVIVKVWHVDPVRHAHAVCEPTGLTAGQVDEWIRFARESGQTQDHLFETWAMAFDEAHAGAHACVVALLGSSGVARPPDR